MKIGLFALETGRNVGGLEVYETNLIRALAEVDDRNEYHVLCLDPCVPEMLEVRQKNFRFHVLSGGRLKGVLWDVPARMASLALDVFHAIFVPPPFTNIPYVFTYHGTEVIERPDFYPFLLGLRMRVLFQRAIARADLILCVSDYVRDRLAADRRIANSRLRTIYNGIHSSFRPAPSAEVMDHVRGQFSLSKPYIVVVGRIEPRKNPVAVLHAYHRFRQNVPDAPILVFAGAKTWSADDFDRTIRELGLSDSVVELGHVDHAALPALYAGARFSVFASQWEGFGLPAIEAMASGTALITSRTTSLPEVTGGACLLIDPHSSEEIAGAMRRLHEDVALRQRLVADGLSRAANFSWTRTAKETLEAYTLVAARTRRESGTNGARS